MKYRQHWWQLWLPKKPDLDDELLRGGGLEPLKLPKDRDA